MTPTSSTAATEAAQKYQLRIGEREDGHNHVYITMDGWRCCLDAAGKEYFALSGIATPERAQRIVDAANGKTMITAALIRNIIGALMSKDILPIETWRKFCDAPMRFGHLNDAQQDAIAALIDTRLARADASRARMAEV
jgi:hypothetical protein